MSNRSSGLFVTSPSTPVSPRTTGYFTTHGTPTLQQEPGHRSSQAMEQIRYSVQRLQSGHLEETRIPDAEAQQREPVSPRKKWWWQKPRWKGVQNRLVTVMIACTMCVIVLSVYLGLALSKQLQLKQEWHVLLVLIILVTTMFFCHSLVRLCLDLTGGGDSDRRRGSTDFSRIPSIAGPGGYAMPREPIRVNTQAPDIIPGMKEPPPVYGLWRCSVRVNPNEFYWIRRQSSGQALTPTSPHTGSRRSMAMSPRPPSYLSDDGVSYAVNAVPEIRTMEPPLPIHPSERGRFL
ncbi:hypothetical protein BZA05DRAFT_21966 [Tricharina praecox]|uniref:uncharacterized protein n=1 Tax=Tricharina praecox TaxID=43433 RepID=UPI00222051CE|nr:uncharacterized protein BZA05DRAFT_21966 [Tricharina praecox]KAI5859122.1 hypothetical protein BZA05DRAFT_21966 [Tricharina praecox]